MLYSIPLSLIGLLEPKYIGSVIMFPDPENVGIAVGILLLAGLQA